MNTRIALEAANYLLQSDKEQKCERLKLFRAILEDNPANPEALSRQALLWLRQVTWHYTNER